MNLALIIEMSFLVEHFANRYEYVVFSEAFSSFRRDRRQRKALDQDMR